MGVNGCWSSHKVGVTHCGCGSSARLSPDCCQTTEPSEGKALQGVGRCHEQTIGYVVASREASLKLLD